LREKEPAESLENGAMRAPSLTQKRAKSLRRAMTQPEQALWSLLRRNQQGPHFRRQHAVGPYILDFYCATARLCVEVDGPVHAEQVAYDERRTRWLAAQGTRVIRFSVEDVERRPAAVIAAIVRAAAPSTA
jgi:very-short-patch-repair endonuclease